MTTIRAHLFRFSLDIVIDHISISYSNGSSRTPIITADELGKFVLFQLCKQIVEDIYREALIYFKNRVKREHVTLFVNYPGKTMYDCWYCVLNEQIFELGYYCKL